MKTLKSLKRLGVASGLSSELGSRTAHSAPGMTKLAVTAVCPPALMRAPSGSPCEARIQHFRNTCTTAYPKSLHEPCISRI